MTEEQFNEIKERLSKWKEDRHLTYENQQAGFLGNVFEEVSEYFRAKDDLEKVDALCDIAIFCFNAFDMDYNFYIKYSTNTKYPTINSIITSIDCFSCKKYKTAYSHNSISLIISLCYNLGHSLGFDFYKCMIETIKEIESRTGYYDNNLKKFIKDEGVYNKENLLEKYPISKYDISEDNTHFIIFDKKGRTETFIKKWYKSHYESCRLLKC